MLRLAAVAAALFLAAAPALAADKCAERCSGRLNDCSGRCTDPKCMERCSSAFDRCVTSCGPTHPNKVPTGGKCYGPKGREVPCPKLP